MQFVLVNNFSEESYRVEAVLSVLEDLLGGPRYNHVSEVFVLSLPVGIQNPAKRREVKVQTVLRCRCSDLC